MIVLTKSKRLRQLGGILETASLLSLRLLFANQSGFRRYPGIALRTYADLGGPCRWQAKAITEIVPGAVGKEIRLAHAPNGGARFATSLAEIAHLALMTRAIEPKVIFEIGTYTGRTALNFALNAPGDCTVYTMDLPPDGARPPGAADAGLTETADPDRDYRGTPAASKIRQILADSTRFDFAPFEKRVDLFFVDGGHHYDAVVADTRNALRCVRPGGLIVWHDFANYGDFADVTRGVLDTIPGDQVVQIEETQLAVHRVG